MLLTGPRAADAAVKAKATQMAKEQQRVVRQLADIVSFNDKILVPTDCVYMLVCYFILSLLFISSSISV